MELLSKGNILSRQHALYVKEREQKALKTSNLVIVVEGKDSPWEKSKIFMGKSSKLRLFVLSAKVLEKL